MKNRVIDPAPINPFQFERAVELLRQSRHTVVFTGAGISTPSGIPDFRSPQSGLWRNADPLRVASIYGFRRAPQEFYDWIYPLAELTMAAQPNAAHLALAELERNGPVKAIITQNIDLLHSKAGSSQVLEVHGHLRELTCIRCYTVYEAEPFMLEFLGSRQAPHCPACANALKPNVILFGEQLPVMVWNEARRQARACDLMLAIGSSLLVAPAGDLPELAQDNGARLIIVNLAETHMDGRADLVFRNNVVDLLPALATAVAESRVN
jgi:NAD-dependent deacetylase